MEAKRLKDLNGCGRTEGVKRKANVMGLGINHHMAAKSHNSTK